MNRYTIPFTILIITILISFLIYSYAALSSKKTQSQSNSTFTIITSFYPLYFFTKEIVGTKAEVQNVTPAGAEPHEYEPTTQNIAQIETSNLLVLNGGHLEPWGNKIREDLQRKHIPIIEAASELIILQMEDNGKTVQDPHIWLSPPLAKQEVRTILNGIIRVDPKNKKTYQTNAQTLIEKLDHLDEEFVERLSTCKKRDFITSHAAFGYLAKTYDLNQVPISGLSPDEEPSTKELAHIAEFAKKNEVKYIFFESLVSPKLSQTIAQEIGAQTLVLDPIEGISDDNLKKGATYFSVMENNLHNLRIALECR